MQQFAILLAAPRSGTSVLGAAAGKAFDAAWLQEVFHSNYVVDNFDFRSHSNLFVRCGFFNFRRMIITRNSRLSNPSYENQEYIFDSYLDYISSVTESEKILIDIKYSSWHHFDDYWKYPYERPMLARLVSERKIPVIHLDRRNRFEQYCSLFFASKFGVWSSDVGTIPVEPATIDCDECLRGMELVDWSVQAFRRWIPPELTREIFYEDMIAENEFSEATHELFGGLFGREPTHRMIPGYRKLTPRLASMVGNRDEVLKYFKGTRYGAMVESALA